MSPSSMNNQFAWFLAKFLRIDINYRQEPKENESIASSDTFVEREPTAKEWLSQFRPSRSSTNAYLLSLFPFLSWIFHYNVQWLIGDLIAGTFPLWSPLSKLF